MIEVEERFLIDDRNANQIHQILTQSKFIKQLNFRDSYFDTPDYWLTKLNCWLRSRDGKFELKIATIDNKNIAFISSYEEVEDEQKIKKFLGFNRKNKKPLENSLILYNFIPFCRFKTTRTKYKHKDFNIDYNIISGQDDFRYEVLEIELMVKTENEIKSAKEKIFEFSKNFDLSQYEGTEGKVLRYLKEKNPNLYSSLEYL